MLHTSYTLYSMSVYTLHNYTYCGLHSIFFLKLVFHFILHMVRKRYSQLNFSVENTEVFFYTELTRIQFKYYIQLKIRIKQWVEMKISFMKLFWRTYFVIFLFFEAFYYETVLVDTGWKVTDLCSVMEPKCLQWHWSQFIQNLPKCVRQTKSSKDPLTETKCLQRIDKY